jgi:nicotinate dehydrogenase subunit B
VVTRIVTAFDCGAVLDPDNLTNQIEGATVMGLGAALFERIRFTGSTILNASLTAYRVPRFGDVPPIEVVLLDRPDEPSAGAGEAPIVAVAPAVAAALHAETGERLRFARLAGCSSAPRSSRWPRRRSAWAPRAGSAAA